MTWHFNIYLATLIFMDENMYFGEKEMGINLLMELT